MSSSKDPVYVPVDGYSSGATRYAEIKHVPMETHFEGAPPGLIQLEGKDFDTKHSRFPEWQGVNKLEFQNLQPPDVSRMHHPSHGTLSEIYATAICGNDLCSSVLYVIGITTAVSGQLAPVCLLLVGGLLYLFTSVYGEACTAFPLNGGTYNLLLNTTTKTIAALAACLTLLSYTATAVVSAAESVTYAYNLYPYIDIYWFTILLMGMVCALAILGIVESAVVALAIFILHMGSMIALVIVGGIYAVQNPAIFWANVQLPLKYSWPVSLVAGFCTAILGVTGFESSANFIEEQKKGVYPKTLFNAWAIVFILNPLLSLVVLGVVDLNDLNDSTGDVLAVAARIAGGETFGLWISAEGAIVLAGAVLTAFVGVTGLVRRLASDRFETALQLLPRCAYPIQCSLQRRRSAAIVQQQPPAPRPRPPPALQRLPHCQQYSCFACCLSCGFVSSSSETIVRAPHTAAGPRSGGGERARAAMSGHSAHNMMECDAIPAPNDV
jgi:hypothetical protein